MSSEEYTNETEKEKLKREVIKVSVILKKNYGIQCLYLLEKPGIRLSKLGLKQYTNNAYVN